MGTTHCGYITTLKNVRPHTNANKLLLGTCFGNTVCVSLNYYEGMLGVYFPCDLQLSEEFCRVHDLVRRKNPETGEYEGGYMDPNKRNVKTIKLRGEPSDGLFMPLSCLDYCFSDGNAANHLSIGDTIDVVNGHEICQKYIPRSNKRNSGNRSEGNHTRKKKVPIAPLFAEHADTEQLPYNLSAFKEGDQIEITLKMHGTSQRTGYLPVLSGYTGPQWAMITIKHPKIFKWLQKKANNAITPIYDWGYVSGTRRTVLENFEGGYYGSNKFREKHSKFFEGKLQKGEEIFYEVVGFTHTGTPIMADCSNKKVNDKNFLKQYGEITTFSYGCEPGQSDIYVYRMTMTNEDGFVIEYSPDFMRYRCEQMGVKTVPVLWQGTVRVTDDWNDAGYTAGEYIQNIAEQFYDGPDPIGKTHVREGVVVRILNRPKFCAYKHKNISFKILEGIIKESATAPDMEEADGLEDSQE